MGLVKMIGGEGEEMKVDNDFEHVKKLYGYMVEDSVQTV